MHSRNYARTLGVVLAVGAVLALGVADLSAQMSDPRIGTWKLNVEKSKYSPGPAPKSATMKIEASGQGETATTEGVNAEGADTKVEYTAQFDGKDYPLTGSQTADKTSLKRIDARTTERTNKKGETVVGTITQVLSEDGKTMTATTTGTNAQGQAMNNVTVWEKQ